MLLDQLKHQEKVTPSLHKLCKYYNKHGFEVTGNTNRSVEESNMEEKHNCI